MNKGPLSSKGTQKYFDGDFVNTNNATPNLSIFRARCETAEFH